MEMVGKTVIVGKPYAAACTFRTPSLVPPPAAAITSGMYRSETVFQSSALTCPTAINIVPNPICIGPMRMQLKICGRIT